MEEGQQDTETPPTTSSMDVAGGSGSSDNVNQVATPPGDDKAEATPPGDDKDETTPPGDDKAEATPPGDDKAEATPMDQDTTPVDQPTETKD